MVMEICPARHGYPRMLPVRTQPLQGRNTPASDTPDRLTLRRLRPRLSALCFRMHSNSGREAVMKKSSLLPMSVATIAVMLTAGNARTEEMENLALIEHAASDVVTDTGAAGDSSGDLLTFANEIFASDNTTKVGTDSGF